ncbi:MAG: AbrB/MazE/SpoVT family DNA-binding domain-containing protein [Candidatus ainarchaeum sp.]|nr:AbrB/MazE/SpoVT family DNA-binding domain-containing protein [Candidatus ainarchaeum sp.]
MNERIRTVIMNSRGQIVIPEEIRNNKGMKPKEALVLIERENELVLKKESDVARQVMAEEPFWAALSQKALEKIWNNKEDDIWETYL